MRQGYGYMTETSQAGSRYSGNWSNDQYDGYGIYDDKVRYHTSLCYISHKIESLYRHYRYLGMFQNNCYHGAGIIITSTGTYCEATFAANKIVESHDTLLMDPNGRSFLGKVSGYFQLIGKVMVIMWCMTESLDMDHVICDGITWCFYRVSWHYTIQRLSECSMEIGLRGSSSLTMPRWIVTLGWRTSLELIIVHRKPHPPMHHPQVSLQIAV